MNNDPLGPKRQLEALQVFGNEMSKESKKHRGSEFGQVYMGICVNSAWIENVWMYIQLLEKRIAFLEESAAQKGVSKLNYSELQAKVEKKLLFKPLPR